MSQRAARVTQFDAGDPVPADAPELAEGAFDRWSNGYGSVLTY